MSPSGRTSHTATMTASSSTATTEVAPTSSVLRRAASTNWPKLCTGLPTLTAPAISWPRRIGAATYITDVLGSPSTSGVVRAPYSPFSVRWISRFCDQSSPALRARESNTTRPARSATITRSSTRVFS